MTPKVVTLKAGQLVLDGPGLDGPNGLLSALKDGSPVEFTLLPTEAENLRRKFRLKARVEGLQRLHTSAGRLGNQWRVKVQFMNSRRFQLADSSLVELDFYTFGYGDRNGGRGGIVWDATPDDERLWVDQVNGSIVRGIHAGGMRILGNIRDLLLAKR